MSVAGLSVCIFVVLYVRMSVAGANKVEGTMSWCVGTDGILASNMAFTAKILSWRFCHLNIVGCLLKRRPTKGGHGHPRTPPPLAQLRPCWVQWCSFLGVHTLVWVLLQDISDLIRLSRTVQHTYFIIYEFCFTCFNVKQECKRSYIFQSSSRFRYGL